MWLHSRTRSAVTVRRFKSRSSPAGGNHSGRCCRADGSPEIERTGRHDLLGRRDRECAAALHIVADLALVMQSVGADDHVESARRASSKATSPSSEIDVMESANTYSTLSRVAS